jgi:ankyrin repeat protein
MVYNLKDCKSNKNPKIIIKGDVSMKELSQQTKIRLEEVFLSAVRNGDDLIEDLMKLEVDVNSKDIYEATALQIASTKGFTETVKILLEAGADPNLSDVDGDTPLIEACSYGYLEIVKLLIAYKADVNAMNVHGTTALGIAKYRKFNEIADLLIEAGAI